MKKQKFALSDGVKFTEKSLTQPNQAFTATELIRRSVNGTMPAVYTEGLAYDFEDFVNGKQVTYWEQEYGDVDPIPSFPQLEDIFEMRDLAKESNSKANYLIKKHLEEEQKQEASTSIVENTTT